MDPKSITRENYLNERVYGWWLCKTRIVKVTGSVRGKRKERDSICITTKKSRGFSKDLDWKNREFSINKKRFIS